MVNQVRRIIKQLRWLHQSCYRGFRLVVGNEQVRFVHQRGRWRRAAADPRAGWTGFRRSLSPTSSMRLARARVVLLRLANSGTSTFSSAVSGIVEGLKTMPIFLREAR